MRLGTGFTLLEMLVVMAIVAMGSALIVPRISGGQVSLLKAQVREAVAVLNYARRSAIVEGRSKTAFFYESARSQGASQPGTWVGRGATLQWGGGQEGQGLEGQAITFYPEGGSTGGEFVLSYQSRRVKVVVNPLTGKVSSEFLEEN